MNGSLGRTRTADPVINSHLLYQLSYQGIEGEVWYWGVITRSRRNGLAAIVGFGFIGNAGVAGLIKRSVWEFSKPPVLLLISRHIKPEAAYPLQGSVLAQPLTVAKKAGEALHRRL